MKIVDTLRAGISLIGSEVKSVREGSGSLQGARVLIRGNEVFLVGATIPPYQVKNTPDDYDPTRTRRLLIGKHEREQLARKVDAKNLTLVPISIYNVGRNLKVDIALARKKLSGDKREVIQKRDAKRTIRKAFGRK